MIRPEDFGAVGDGVTDDSAAIQAALDAIPPSGSGLHGGGTVAFAARTYKVNSTLHVRRPVRVVGEGVDLSAGGSCLRMGAGAEIRITGPNALNDFRGDGAIVEGLLVVCDDATTPGGGVPARGVFIAAAGVSLRDISVQGFPSHGIEVHANAPDAYASQWDFYRVSITSCAGSGFRIHGSDSNAGNGWGCSATDCREWGIHDSSFLHSNWYGPHLDANRLGPYCFDSPTGRTQIFGAYTEEGQPPAQMPYKGMAFGGIQGAGFASGFRIGHFQTDLPEMTPIAVHVAPYGAGHHSIPVLRIGSFAESGPGGEYLTFQTLARPGHAGSALYFGNFAVRQGEPDLDRETWLGYTNNPGLPAPTRIAVPGQDGKTAYLPGSMFAPPARVPAGVSWFSQLRLGEWGSPKGGAGTILTSGKEGCWAVGNSGSWNVGSVVFNTEAGGPDGWRCIAPGEDSPWLEDEGVTALTTSDERVWLYKNGQPYAPKHIKLGQVIAVGPPGSVGRGVIAAINVDDIPGKLQTFLGRFGTATDQPVGFSPPVMRPFGGS